MGDDKEMKTRRLFQSLLVKVVTRVVKKERTNEQKSQ